MTYGRCPNCSKDRALYLDKGKWNCSYCMVPVMSYDKEDQEREDYDYDPEWNRQFDTREEYRGER